MPAGYGYGPPPAYGSGVPAAYGTGAPIAGVPYAQPGSLAPRPARQQQPDTPPAPNGGPPQGYHLVNGGRSDAAPAAKSPMGGGGKVMYFHKPVDALVPNPTADAPGVALAADSAPPAMLPVPDLSRGPAGPPVAALPVFPPAGERPIPSPGVVVPLPTAPPAYTAVEQPVAPQPKTSTSDKKQEDLASVDPKITKLPSRQFIFTLYNDQTLEREIIKALERELAERTSKDKEKDKKPVVNDRPQKFPDSIAVRNELAPPGTVYVPKTVNYAPGQAVYEPAYVVHRRLHFEEKNTERYGWDLGFVQPFVSTMAFYKDVILWPHSLASGTVRGFWDTSAGKCLPGSPIPYYLYPPGLTITGSVVEAGVITGLAFIIP